MKKIIFIFCLLLFTSCITMPIKESKKPVSLEKQLNALPYKVVLPKYWKAYKDLHGEISFKPINQFNKKTNNQINITKINSSNRKDLTLSEFVDEKSINIDFVSNYSRKKTPIKTKYGATYVLDEEFKLNSRNVLIRSIFFEYQKDYYRFSYYSNPIYFDDYIDDFGFIFEKLEFKN